MRQRITLTVGMCWLLLAGAAGAADTPTDKPPTKDLAPEEVVTRYLEAMKAGDFSSVYDQITKDMSQGKSREAWAKEQQWTTQMSDAKIFDYHVYPGKVDGGTARVPNILSSQDKFLNQLGVQEYELYSLIREDGRWKINQQVLLEKSEQSKWFPSLPQAAPPPGAVPPGAVPPGK